MTDDDEKTPVRTPSGTHRIGLVPCPKCKRDARVDAISASTTRGGSSGTWRSMWRSSGASRTEKDREEEPLLDLPPCPPGRAPSVERWIPSTG